MAPGTLSDNKKFYKSGAAPKILCSPDILCLNFGTKAEFEFFTCIALSSLYNRPAKSIHQKLR